MGSREVTKFVSRIVAGCIISIFLGSYLDDCFNTRPIIMFLLLIYVIVGSLYILIHDSKKSAAKIKKKEDAKWKEKNMVL